MKSIVRKVEFFSCGKKFGDNKIIAIRETYRSRLQETANEKEAIKHTSNSVKCNKKVYFIRGNAVVSSTGKTNCWWFYACYEYFEGFYCIANSRKQFPYSSGNSTPYYGRVSSKYFSVHYQKMDYQTWLQKKALCDHCALQEIKKNSIEEIELEIVCSRH